VEHYLQELEALLALRHEEIAAMVLEPLIQAAAGMVFHPPSYLAGVRELTRQYDVLLIADEIVTAFGRTGRMFACEHEEVVPDILCLGKSITGGYLPLSATVTSPEIFEAFLGPADSGRSFLHGHTYSGNPLASAAALASLDVLEEEQTLRQLTPKSEQLAGILATLEAHPHVAETRQLGMIAAVELTPEAEQNSSRYPSELQIANQICRDALQHGVWLRPLRDTLVIMPPLSITSEELELLGQVLFESINTVTKAIATADVTS